MTTMQWELNAIAFTKPSEQVAAEIVALHIVLISHKISLISLLLFLHASVRFEKF